MREYITKTSSLKTDIKILNKCPKLTKIEINHLFVTPLYVRRIVYIKNININKLLKNNPELIEIFI